MIGSILAAALLFQASGPATLQNTQASDLTNEGYVEGRQQIPTDAAERRRLGVICRRETEMGSNRARRICTTAVQRDEARMAAERTLDRHTTGTPTNSPVNSGQNDLP